MAAVAWALSDMPPLGAPADAAAERGPERSARACTDIRSAGLLVLNAGCGRPTVLYVHAANETVADPLRPDVLTALAAAGYQVVMGDLCGPLNWGSPCAVEQLHALRQRFSPEAPVRVLAVSMGGAGLLNLADTHPGDVLAAVGVVPVTTWDTPWLQEATAGALPPLPERARFSYRILAAKADEVVGPPVLRGRHVSVAELPGTHDLWQQIDAATVVKAVRSS